MVRSVFDILPSEAEIDAMLCVASREAYLLKRLIPLARAADEMRGLQQADRATLDHCENTKDKTLTRRPLTRAEALYRLRRSPILAAADPAIRQWVLALMEHGERAGSGDKMDKTCVK